MLSLVVLRCAQDGKIIFCLSSCVISVDKIIYMLMYYQRDYTEFRHVFASCYTLAPPGCILWDIRTKREHGLMFFCHET